MKNKRWHNYIWRILCIAILLLVMPASGTTQAQEVDGYWKLISVDVEKCHRACSLLFPITSAEVLEHSELKLKGKPFKHP